MKRIAVVKLLQIGDEQVLFSVREGNQTLIIDFLQSKPLRPPGKLFGILSGMV
ncbi:MAG: hypothetical protein WDN75_04285 [Bacteroidota bacterium]